MQVSVSHVHMISGRDRTHHLMKSKPYSLCTSHHVLLKSRVTASNGPIQRTRPVPRACGAIQLYSARVYSRAIQHTAYTLYSPIRRSSVSVLLTFTLTFTLTSPFPTPEALTLPPTTPEAPQKGAPCPCNGFIGIVKAQGTCNHHNLGWS